MEDYTAVAEAEVAEVQHEQNEQEILFDVGEAFSRYRMLANKMARQFTHANRQDFGKLLEDDNMQLAAVGLLEAIQKYGYEVSPLQVKSYILDQFREAVQREIKANPWRRSTCPECGSQSVVECEHKKAFRKSGKLAPEYVFGKKEHEQINIGWTIWAADSEDSMQFGETIEDMTDSSAAERELKLEHMKQLARNGISKLPADVGKLLLMRSVLWNGGNPATWPEIAAALGCARTTAIRRHQAAMVWLSGIAKGPRPRFSSGKTPRLCTMFPTYRRNQRIPWSQDENFSLSVIPGFRSAEGYAEVMGAERAKTIVHVDDDQWLNDEHDNWGRPHTHQLILPNSEGDITNHKAYWESQKIIPFPIAGSDKRDEQITPEPEEDALFNEHGTQAA